MSLFSKHTHSHTEKTHTVPYAKNVKVTEHRAPTDESIRILNEMEEKARKNIIGRIRLTDNLVQGEAIFYQDCAGSTYEIIVDVRVCVNGRVIDMKGNIDCRQIRDSHLTGVAQGPGFVETYGMSAAIGLIHEKVGAMIAQEIIRPELASWNKIKDAIAR